MLRPIQIAPSILTADFGRLAEQVAAAEQAGADLIHLDVMDGRFVPNITFGPGVVAAVRAATTLPLDVHLMIEDPERYVDAFAQAGATGITVHLEATRHPHRAVQQIVEAGCRAGVALNPATPVEYLREISPFADLVLVMSVNPGYGGQRFIETSTSKLRRVRKLLDEFNPTCDLEVDGGVGPHNIGDVVRNGANVIVVGSAIYNKEGEIAENLARLRQAAGEG
ncbi:MAG: ribulose-phosphate 3-epimerase [Caldilineaceae bacterium]|nr:ribulose-phosphate 3-epimerase [Caldilineaceae bacterium]HRJ40550.1 ribulose-phosphate 3-epimerase [Caldilineaceae bacterium]